jgi:hypothetical protein
MYFDGDSDGYGSGAIRRCGTKPIAGYVTRSGDCCDTDPGAHPGATVASTSRTACLSYDWNCNGLEEVAVPSSANKDYSCGCSISAGKFGSICVACK